jgi:hypothetical protein
MTTPSMRRPVDVKAQFRFLLSKSLFPFSQAAWPGFRRKTGAKFSRAGGHRGLNWERPPCTERKSLTKSADGRVATEAAWLECKESTGRKEKNTFDSYRPSHGRS